MKRKRKKSKTKNEVSFFKEYNFEITVFAMFLLGIFLLVEKMEISQTLFKVIKATIRVVEVRVESKEVRKCVAYLQPAIKTVLKLSAVRKLGDEESN